MMIKKSIRTYLAGFIMGMAISAAIFRVYPNVYYLFKGVLIKKLEIQKKIIPSLPLMLIVNNILASIICAFGGYLFARLYIQRGIERPSFYNISLTVFPVLVLFVNGFVLGAFLPPFIKDLTTYFSLLLPHGVFELPATILSGSIGFDIASISIQEKDSLNKFKERIDTMFKGKMYEYKIVMALIVIGGIVEGIWPL